MSEEKYIKPDIFIPIKWETTKGVDHFAKWFGEVVAPETEDCEFEVIPNKQIEDKK